MEAYVNTTNNEEGLVRGVTYDTEPEKTYLILMDGLERGEGSEGETLRPIRDWEIKVGRQQAYDYIKNMLESEYAEFNIYKSKIIVDSITFKDGVSIYEFMKNMKEGDKVIDYTSFDIEDYTYTVDNEEGAE